MCGIEHFLIKKRVVHCTVGSVDCTGECLFLEQNQAHYTTQHGRLLQTSYTISSGHYDKYLSSCIEVCLKIAHGN